MCVCVCMPEELSVKSKEWEKEGVRLEHRSEMYCISQGMYDLGHAASDWLAVPCHAAQSILVWRINGGL